jgi:hypothetical protein
MFVNPVKIAAPLTALVSLLVVVAFSASPAFASFGFQTFENTLLNQGGVPDEQAGSHPVMLTTTIKFKTALGFGGEAIPDEDVKDVEVALPPGVSGNANAVPRCTIEQFTKENPHRFLQVGLCPDDTQVGIAQIEITPQDQGEPIPAVLGIYNLVPPHGVPAEFGINPLGIPVIITPKVRTGSDYGLTAVSKNTPQAQRIFGLKTTFWGVPAASSHDGERGECLGEFGETFVQGEEHPCPVETAPRPLLTLPTSCPEGSLGTAIHADSWQHPVQNVELEGVSEVAFNHDGEGHPVGVTGCEDLNFSPTINIRPDTEAAGAPAGASAEVSLPQNENPNGLAEANLKTAVVTLPKGLTVSPAAANGLQACSIAEIGYTGTKELDPKGEPGVVTPQFVERVTNPETGKPEADLCPSSSKIGSVKISTPLLEGELEGSLYLAAPQNFSGPQQNPFSSLVAVYLVAEDPNAGVLVKLPGKVAINEATGQITASFEDTPQQPFSHLTLKLFGGPRAALMTPRECGTYSVESEFAPWSGTAPVKLTQPFQITSGCENGFSPEFNAGTVSNQAGAFSPFSLSLSRTDHQQGFKQLTVKTPPGFSGLLSKVTLCGEPQAAAGTCPEASKIGHVIVGAGPGPDPVYVPQPGKPQDPVYLTGPYNGAPFGLSVVVPAEAGPFNLGTVVVRSKIEVDPHTGQVTIVSDPFPTILKGIPLDIKTINVVIDREGFIFNPTSCEPSSVAGAVVSEQGATAPIASHFQAVNCANLAFKPRFSVSTSGRTSRADGASLDVRLAYPSGSMGMQANVKSARVELPKAMPSRLTTLQKACTAKQFDTNPAGCPAESVVGHAIAHTPILPVPLEGPAYFVSNGSEAFPNLIAVLEGDGVKIELVGDTDIKKGVTSSTFPSTPDVPIESFELVLPQGKYSALGANGNLCQQHLVMPTELTGQNGASFKQQSRVEVEGCSNALGLVSKKLEGRTLTLKVAVPSAGKLTIGGRGVHSKTKSAAGRETLTLSVSEKRAGRLRARLKIAFAPAHGKKLTKTLTVKFER